MHNGHAGGYMNAAFPSHVLHNSNSNIPYYLSNNHLHPSSYLASCEDGFSGSEKKHLHDSNEYLNRKTSKNSQRPATAKSTEGKFDLETNTAMIYPSHKRGIRKKTLSLNPEEREALESLVEDVILVGMKDAVLDSDESSDENVNDDEVKDTSNNVINNVPEIGKEIIEMDKKSIEKTVKETKNEKLKPIDENFATTKSPNYVQDLKKIKSSMVNKNFMKNFNKNNNAINQNLLNHNNIFKPSVNKNNHYLNKCNGQTQDLNKKHLNEKLPPLGNIPSHEINNEQLLNDSSLSKSRQNINNMLSLNIYPAQLKVAIKHMESLPPRFLKRLQTGSNKIGGSEPTLQSLSELNLNQHSLQSSLSSVFPSHNQSTFSAKTSPVTQSIHHGSFSENNSVCNSVEKDKSKNKQTQLEETKKIIRNLLGDLDQYTDEAINQNNEDDRKYQHLSNASLTQQAMLHTPYAPADPSFRMNSNRFNSESQLNSLDLQPSQPIRGSVSLLNNQTTSRQFNSLDVAQEPSSIFHLKNTPLKPDAPVFVSNNFLAKSEVGKTRLSDPEITFLPGVLNANVPQHNKITSNKAPVSQPTMPPNYPYKMVPSPFYTPMPSCNQQQLYPNYMPMLNYNQQYRPYNIPYNNYNQQTQSYQQPLFYNTDYQPNQIPYQPWIPSSIDSYSQIDENNWYGVSEYMPQCPPISERGPGLWEEYGVEEGRMRVSNVMKEGSQVAVFFLGSTNKFR